MGLQAQVGRWRRRGGIHTDGLGARRRRPGGAALGSGILGLTAEAARARLAASGPNADDRAASLSPARALLRRLLEPLALILLAAGLVSIATGDAVGDDGAICSTIRRPPY